MARILSKLDLRENEVRNLKLINASIEILPDAPSNPKLGQIYFDSTLAVFRIWSEENWIELPTVDNVIISLDSKKLGGYLPEYYLDASNLTGTVPIGSIPKGALERVVVVGDDNARLALTIEQVQQGDVVKVNSTGLMYYVTDQTQLDSEDGYHIFTAGIADTANKVANSLSIQLNNNEVINYDGSELIHIDITPSEIGAATEAQGLLSNQSYNAISNAKLSNDTPCSIDPINGGLIIPATKVLKFEINNPLSPMVIEHNFGRNPTVTVIDLDGNLIECSIFYSNENQVEVSWNGNFSGYIYLI